MAEKKKRVLVGMSGGVDSSVAVLLLKKAGYEVIGVTMQISADDVPPGVRKLACYGENKAEEIKDIEAVARHIGIDFYVVDLKKEFEEHILTYFREEYASGRTPNPCVKCNAEIKFGLLLEGCKKLGLDYDYFSTGHYARARHDDGSGRYLLLKAKDKNKDQSYFLSLLSQEQLARSIFPLGELTKREVRRIAREDRLPVSDKEESQDFYAGDYRELLKKGKPGPIKDVSGNVIGQHEGIENYTIGQRRGLGIASTGRLYVVKIDAPSNTVIVGEEKDLKVQTFTVEKINWIARVVEAGEEIEAAVKVRYKSPELACRLIPTMGGQDEQQSEKEPATKREQIERTKSGKNIPTLAEVTLFSPYKAITPGQVAVFYEGEVILGAGFIVGPILSDIGEKP